MADDPIVPFTGKGTIYHGAGAPFPPGTTVHIPQSHAEALRAAGHAMDAAEEKAAPAKTKG